MEIENKQYTKTVNELEKELREIKAARDAASDAREQRRAAKALADEIEICKTTSAMDAIFDDLIESNGRKAIERVDLPNGKMIVVKKPAHVAYQRMTAKARKDDITSKDCDILVKSCLLYPSWDEYALAREEWPGLETDATNAALNLGRVGRATSEGK